MVRDLWRPGLRLRPSRTSGIDTMPLTDLVAPNAVIPALKVGGKKQALQELAARAAALTGQNERTIFETLLQRERLGSTGGRQWHRDSAWQACQARPSVRSVCPA